MKVNIGKYPKGKDVKRRISIQIEKFDLWDFSGSVGLVLLEWLKAFKASDKHGIPAGMRSYEQSTDSYHPQECFDFYKEDNPPFEQAEKEWDEILEKIIWSFDEIINQTNDNCYWDVKPKIDWDATFDDSNLKDEFYSTIWEVQGKLNHLKMQQYEDRIQEGLDLFSKYVRNLWD